MKSVAKIERSNTRKGLSITYIILCSVFGIATILTFFAPKTWLSDLTDWFNWARIAVYLLFLIFLFKVLKTAPKIEVKNDNKKYQVWVKRIIIILPMLAVGFAMINAFLPEIGGLVRMGDNDIFKRPGAFLRMACELTSCGIFVSLIPHFVKQKKWIGAGVLVLLALVLFVMGMEEISWGQRIFKWETTGYFTDNNEQKETNLHNLATQLFQNVLFFGGFVLLVVLPFFRDNLKKLLQKTKRLRQIDIFLPESWMMIAFGAGLMFVDPLNAASRGIHYGSVCFQSIAIAVFLGILAHRLHKTDKIHYDLALRTLACALIVLTLSLCFDGLWNKNQGTPTEYIKIFVNFGILCWAIGVRTKTKLLQRKNTTVIPSVVEGS
ncbi:hypothetical protein FWF74_02105 [Candidatus Saccharibacteria bacterium]|nr:hypothetical protein [Candidatus Saccharibacteria bacterium]MCL1963250.1 hypothetical protein [Candidatus Saccharibacteria bacterium]